MITSRQISLGIEEDRVFLGHNIEFVVKGVITDLFHIVPIGDEIVLMGYLRVKNATFLTYVDYDAYVLQPLSSIWPFTQSINCCSSSCTSEMINVDILVLKSAR